MAYATLQDLTDRFGTTELTELTQQDGSGQIDAAMVDGRLGDASALVDGYANARYQLPLNPVPASIVGLVCDIARFMLHKDEVPAAIASAYSNALRVLRDVASGAFRLEAAGIEDSGSPNRVAAIVPETVFTPGFLGGWS